MNQQKTRRHQGGFTMVELLIVLAIMAVLILGVMTVRNETRYSSQVKTLQDNVSEITSGVQRWQKARPNLTGVSMEELCETGRTLLTPAVCGTADNGSSANPFGGDYTVTANTNPSQFDLAISGLPTDRINDIADTLAPMTAARCNTADSCSSIVVSGTSVTLTL